MKLRQKPEGEWFPFFQEGSSEPSAEFRIRPIPAEVVRGIEVRKLGRKRQYTHKKGATMVEVDVDQAGDVALEKAVYALLDSKGAEDTVTCAGDAAFYAPIVGRELSVGDSVALDGHWTEEVRRHVFAAVPALALWILEQARALTLQAREEDEERAEGF